MARQRRPEEDKKPKAKPGKGRELPFGAKRPWQERPSGLGFELSYYVKCSSCGKVGERPNPEVLGDYLWPDICRDCAIMYFIQHLEMLEEENAQMQEKLRDALRENRMLRTALLEPDRTWRPSFRGNT